MKGLLVLYKKYLEHNLPKMKKEQLVELTMKAMLAAIDEANEKEIEAILSALEKDIKRNPDRWDKDEIRAILQRGDEEVPPALPDGESDEDMYAPATLEEAAYYLQQLPETDEVTEIDIENAMLVIESLYPYLFSTEMPVIGISSGALAMAWVRERSGIALIFIDDSVYLEYSDDGDLGRQIILSEEGTMSKEDVEAVLKEIHAIKY